MTNELTRLSRDYAMGIRAALAEPNPEWAERDGYDLFWGKALSLIGELKVETGLDVHFVALDHQSQTTCFGTGEAWFDLTETPIDEREVFCMVQAGAWMVVSDGARWDAKTVAFN